MRNSPIRIGPIRLQDFEVPSSVRFGGRHRLAIHHLVDGNRVVERLGPDDSEITFEGTFSGRGAEDRVRAFDKLRLSGESVWLTWESFKRKIVVRTFTADFQSPSWIHYKVGCVVETQELKNPTQLVMAGVGLISDLNSALLATSGSPVDLSTLQAALGQRNAFIDGTLNHSQAVAAVAGGLNAIEARITQQTDAIMTGLGPATSPSQFRDLFNHTVESAGYLASAVNARAYVARIGVNLSGFFS